MIEDHVTAAPEDRLLTAPEVAEILAVAPGWVREHTRTGQIPHLRLGRHVRYRRAGIEQWLTEQESGGAAWGKHKPRKPRVVTRGGAK